MRRARLLVAGLVVLALLSAGAAFAKGSQTPPRVTWHHKCIKQYHFCADYPYVNGAKGPVNGFDRHVYYLPLGSSATGKEPAFESWINRDHKTGKLCRQLNGPLLCEDSEFYSVSVFRSKFSDPWTALTAINGGVKNPIRTSVQGNLACRFTKGIYRSPGLVIYHRGMVYLLQVGGIGGRGGSFLPRYTARFLASIRLS